MTLADLIADVCEWHLSRFGREPMDGPIAAKLVEEAHEFKECPCGEEAADVLIVLCAWAGRHGVDLMAEARAKLERVKGRDQIARDKARGIL